MNDSHDSVARSNELETQPRKYVLLSLYLYFMPTRDVYEITVAQFISLSACMFS
jgi:hypothetical protein